MPLYLPGSSLGIVPSITHSAKTSTNAYVLTLPYEGFSSTFRFPKFKIAYDISINHITYRRQWQSESAVRGKLGKLRVRR